MFFALVNRFVNVQHITKPCSAKDIDGDVVIFYDVHSNHHIDIDGIENHKAVKYEYFNDPHQKDFDGYMGDRHIVKLGAEKRSKRAMERGIDFVICPCYEKYFEYIEPHLENAEDKLVWFPVSPKKRVKEDASLMSRTNQVFANGHLWRGEDGFKPYEFRNWAYRQECVSYIPHTIEGKTPRGANYQSFLSNFTAGLALCDYYVVPKYFEIPLAGCVLIAQDNPDFKLTKFKDEENCIVVNKENFVFRVEEFLNHFHNYQWLADNGRKIVEENYTADRFAEYIYSHAKSKVNREVLV
jgi:hypothetical protein